MNISVRLILVIVALVVCVAIGGATVYWQPDRSAMRAMTRFMKAVEKRDWERVRDTMTDDYQDEWTEDRSTTIQWTSEALSGFFFLHIEMLEPGIVVNDDSAKIETRLKLQGNGTGVAQIVMGRVNALDEKFLFSWRKESWKPWDWRLYSATQSEISTEARSLLP